MPKNILFTIIFFVLISLLSAFNVSYLQETFDFVELEISLSDIEFLDRNGYAEIILSNSTQNSDPDSPDIPRLMLYFAVPINGDLRVEVQDFNRQTFDLSSPLVPVARQNVDDPMLLEYHVDTYKYVQSKKVYEILPKQTLGRYDIVPVELNLISYDFYQNQVSYPQTTTLKVYISGDFPRNITEHSSDEKNIYSEIITNYKYGLNFQQTRNVTFNTSEFYRSHSWYKIQVSNAGMHILDYQFLTELPLSDIDPRTIRMFSTGGSMLSPVMSQNTARGLPFVEIPLLITGEESGVFGQSDIIYFYAEHRDLIGKNTVLQSNVFNLGDFHPTNPYSKEGIYWLTWGGDFGEAPPKRIIAKDNIQNHEITRATGHATTLNHSPLIRRHQYGFEWFSHLLQSKATAQTEYQFNLHIEDMNTDFKPEFSFIYGAESFKGTYDPNHEMSMQINGRQAFSRIWNEISLFRGTVAADNANFINGNNSITITTKGNNINQYLMYFELQWYRNLVKRNGPLAFRPHKEDANRRVLYEIGNPTLQNLSVFQVNSFNEVYALNTTGNNFVADASSDAQFIIVASNEYLRPASISLALPVTLDLNPPVHDVMIVYPPEFKDGVDRLAEIYRNKEFGYGYNVHMVTIQSIFDNFNGGYPDPVAIRNYLQYLNFFTPGTAPMGAVFIGTGTIDNRNFSGNASEKNKFLVNQLDYDADHRINTGTTSDDNFAYMTQNEYPEIIVGRIPINTDREFSEYLNKLEEYLKNTNAGWWQFQFQIIADDEHYSNGTGDGYHSDHAEGMARLMDRNILVDRLYALEYELDAFKRKPHVRDILVNKINEGRLYWLYIGHGSIRNTGDERYFNADFDLPLLHNKGKYPIFIAASCEVGQYELPGIKSLAEELILLRNAGSIISIAATGKSYASTNEALFRSFVSRAINEKNMPAVALISAKMANKSGKISNPYYNILGDPFLKASYPTISNNFSFNPPLDTLKIRQTVRGEGYFDLDSNIQIDKVQSLVYDSGREYFLTYVDGTIVELYSTKTRVLVFRDNLPVFNGSSTVKDSSYKLAFVVPEGVKKGNRGKIFSMGIDKNTNRAFLNIKQDINISDEVLDVSVPEKPQIDIYIDSFDFKQGDRVSPKPVMYARIHAEFGLNTIGVSGQNMMVFLKSTNELMNVTAGFEYDIDSFTTGTLTWQLNELSPGRHDLQLIIYDSFNNIAVSETWFVAAENVPIAIKNNLFYPNPFRSGERGYFSFDVTHDADITIQIYTITGRRIKTIHRYSYRKDQYDPIEWDGRDGDGDRIANGTYIYTIKATVLDGKGTREITDKLVILR